MKVANFIQAGLTEFEERKRALQRREMGEAYKKTAKFVEVSKNPMLVVLENILSGKTEKDLLATDVQSLDETLVLDEGLDQKVESKMEQVNQTALAPTQPSQQDLPIAASASTQIQQTEAILREATVDVVEETEPDSFVGEDLSVTIPERFLNDFKRDATAPTVFGKEYESLLFQRTFHKVVEKYTAHMTMVKNGYRSMNEPSFSKIA